MQKKGFYVLSVAAILPIMSIAANAYAATGSGMLTHGKRATLHGAMMPKPAVVGKVATINGTTLKVTGLNGTIYTVDAATAKVTKGFGANAKALTLADIKVDDAVAVTGAVTGNTVIATGIMDTVGLMPHGAVGGLTKPRPQFVFGTVSNVNALGFTVTVPGRGKNSTTTPVAFSVATNSTTTVTKDGKAATLADIAANQTVMAMGTVDRTAHTVTATKVNIVTVNPLPNNKGKGRGWGQQD